MVFTFPDAKPPCHLMLQIKKTTKLPANYKLGKKTAGIPHTGTVKDWVYAKYLLEVVVMVTLEPYACGTQSLMCDVREDHVLYQYVSPDDRHRLNIPNSRCY